MVYLQRNLIFPFSFGAKIYTTNTTVVISSPQGVMGALCHGWRILVNSALVHSSKFLFIDRRSSQLKLRQKFCATHSRTWPSEPIHLQNIYQPKTWKRPKINFHASTFSSEYLILLMTNVFNRFPSQKIIIRIFKLCLFHIAWTICENQSKI